MDQLGPRRVLDDMVVRQLLAAADVERGTGDRAGPHLERRGHRTIDVVGQRARGGMSPVIAVAPPTATGEEWSQRPTAAFGRK